MKRLLFIYNPHAGRQKARTILPTALEVFARMGYLTTVFPTQGRGDAVNAAASLSAGFDRVVCCGGDGTLNETVSGLMKLPAALRPVLGYIPAGSANDFSRNFAIPKEIDKAAEIACTGAPCLCDLGLAGDRWFTYVAAFGLFTNVAYSTPQNTKNLLGHTAYLLEAASQLTSIPSYNLRVETEDQVIEGEFIYGMVGNTVSVGGLVRLPMDSIKLDDGLFEVLLVRKPRNPLEWQSAFRTLTTQQMDPNGPIVGLPARKITFTCDTPLPWTLDGEFGGEHTVLEVKNQQQMLAFARSV